MGVALVTGGRGFVGGWLAKALLERGDEVVSFDRRRLTERPVGDRDARDRGRAGPGRGGADRRRARSRTVLAEHRVDTVFHLAAETIVGTVQASPVQGFESNVRGTWTLLAGVLERGVERRRRRLLRQGLRRPRGASLPRGLRAAADRALRGVEGGGRPDRAQLLALVRAAGRGDPVREHLRRRRPQLLAPDPRGGERRDPGPRAGAALRRLAGARLPLRRGRGVAPTWRSPTASIATTSAARRSTPAAGALRRSATWSR